MRREIRKLKTFPGRVFCDIVRKIAGKVGLKARPAKLLGLVENLLAQQPRDRSKLSALPAPEVARIAKGKARTPHAFGAKVAATKRQGLGADGEDVPKQSLRWPYTGWYSGPGCPNDRSRTGGERVYVGKGYVTTITRARPQLYCQGHKRRLSPQMRRKLKPRSAIEATRYLEEPYLIRDLALFYRIS